MKKKVFRERYADYVKNIETYEEHIEEPKVEVEVEEKPKKRGRKNAKSSK